MTTNRMVVLVTSHRVAPGLLTAQSWQLLATANVFSATNHALHSPLADAGIEWTTLAAEQPSELAQQLVARLDVAGQRPVVWLARDTADAELASALAPLLMQRADSGEHVELEVMHGSYDIPGSRLLDVVAVMDQLRSPGGCPWDAEQDHRTLAQYLLEETYETLEAIDHDDADGLREELGDLLLQVVFHSRIAEEDADRPWSIDDVAAGLVAKLINRHPHVFSDATATSAAHVESTWQHLKAQEKGRTSVLDGVPAALPALALSAKYLARAEHGGVDVDVVEPQLPDDLDTDSLGALLLGIVSVARRQGIDAEAALRISAHEFASLVRRVESDGAASSTAAG